VADQPADERRGGESRPDLEAAHHQLVQRLHRKSDDFDATRELQLVIAALQNLPERRPRITSTST
jgi:hypothetical protein